MSQEEDLQPHIIDEAIRVFVPKAYTVVRTDQYQYLTNSITQQISETRPDKLETASSIISGFTNMLTSLASREPIAFDIALTKQRELMEQPDSQEIWDDILDASAKALTKLLEDM